MSLFCSAVSVTGSACVGWVECCIFPFPSLARPLPLCCALASKGLGGFVSQSERLEAWFKPARPSAVQTCWLLGLLRPYVTVQFRPLEYRYDAIERVSCKKVVHTFQEVPVTSIIVSDLTVVDSGSRSQWADGCSWLNNWITLGLKFVASIRCALRAEQLVGTSLVSILPGSSLLLWSGTHLPHRKLE
eukprot:1145569-Pelagomonas_calceolata.AAC.2